MVAVLALLSGSAQAGDAADWQGSRWLIVMEEVFPVEPLWQSMTNEEFIVKAAQTRAILRCDQAQAEGKRTVVTCTAESVAIQAVSHEVEPSAQQIEQAEAVVDEMAERLVAIPIEIVFDKQGRINRVDALLAEARNDRERVSGERLRQLATDLVAGWSFQTPRAWTGTWQEFNPYVARVPGMSQAGGSSLVTHSAAETGGRTIVQTVGSGLALAYYEPWELEAQERLASQRGTGTIMEGGPSAVSGESSSLTWYNERPSPGGSAPIGATPETVGYDVSVRSVAVVEGSVVTERVWSTAGAATSGSVGSFDGVNLWYSGHVRRLGPDEQPDLGPSRLVAAPGVEIAGLESWQPIDG